MGGDIGNGRRRSGGGELGNGNPTSTQSRPDNPGADQIAKEDQPSVK